MKFIFRKKKLINSGLQLKMIAAFLFLSCISALFQVTLLNRSIMSLSSLMESDGDILLSELPSLLVSNMILTLGVLLPIMLLVGILITHRIAGPIYRFEQHLASIARGENPGVCKIRDGDELHTLCEAINNAVAQLQEESNDSSEEATGPRKLDDAEPLAPAA